MKTYLQAIIVFYFVFSFAEPYTNVLFGNYFKYFIIMMVVLFNGYFKGRRSDYAIMLVFWFIYQFFTLIWSTDYVAFQTHFLGELLMITLLLQIFACIDERRVFDHVILATLLSSFAISLLSLFFSDGYHGADYTRYVLVIGGAENDPNNQAAFSLYSYIISLYYLNKVNFFKKVILLVILSVSVISMFNTGSRGAFIATAVPTAIMLWGTFSVKNNKGLSYRVLLITGIILIIMIIPSFIRQFLMEESVDRVFYEDYGTGSERTVIWNNIFNKFSSNILYIIFGLGWGTANTITGLSNTSYVSLHNTPLAILVNTGIIGFSLFYYPIYCIMKLLLKKKDYLPFFLFLGQFIISLFLECINTRFYWNAIMIIFFAAAIDSKDSDSVQDDPEPNDQDRQQQENSNLLDHACNIAAQ
jgi:hypothetical protein